MRIIAGRARGTQLFAPKGTDTRPTLDRIKESLFNILQSHIPDALVLDLFAGSGALALESISRGAQGAVLVDYNREAQTCILKNIEKLRMGEQATLIPCQWSTALEQCVAKKHRFDLIYLDPPYRMHILAEIADALAQKKLLANNAVLVLEHQADYVPILGESFSLLSIRTYGDTHIHLYQYHQKSE